MLKPSIAYQKPSQTCCCARLPARPPSCTSLDGAAQTAREKGGKGTPGTSFGRLPMVINEIMVDNGKLIVIYHKLTVIYHNNGKPIMLINQLFTNGDNG